MTNSWWSGEPGEHLLKARRDLPATSDEVADGRRLPITWWIVVVVLVLVAAFVGAASWLVYNAADHCRNVTDGCFQPTR